MPFSGLLSSIRSELKSYKGIIGYNMEPSKHFLQRIFKPESFKNEELELILSQFTRVEFRKNDHLIERGKIASYYYFLESGFLRSYVIDLDGNDITTNFIEEDIVIDWHSYFLKKPCKESTIALSDGNCWRINFQNFMNLFNIEPFREVGRTRLIQNYFHLKNHSISIVTDQAKDRYLQLLSDKPSVIQMYRQARRHVYPADYGHFAQQNKKRDRLPIITKPYVF